MSARDAEAFVGEAVESILAQTLSDFELVVVDDASTDRTREVIEAFGDERVRVLANDASSGLSASLNTALDEARGEYIARLDADDIAVPERLAAQVAHLDERPGISIVGSAATMIDSAGRAVGLLDVPSGPLAVRWELLLGSPFVHPSVLWRREAFERVGLRYDESLRVAQDYDLWARALAHLDGDNLDRPLVLYRRHEAQATSTRRAEQLATHDAVAALVIRRELQGLVLERGSIGELRAFAIGGDPPTREPLDAVVVAHAYLELFEIFARAHAGAPELRALRSRVRERAADRVLQLSPGVRTAIRVAVRHPRVALRAGGRALGRASGRRAP